MILAFSHKCFIKYLEAYIFISTWFNGYLHLLYKVVVYSLSLPSFSFNRILDKFELEANKRILCF